MVISFLFFCFILVSPVSASTDSVNNSQDVLLETDQTIETMNTLKHRVIDPTGVSFPKTINVQKQNAHISGTHEHNRVPTNSVIGRNLEFARYLLNTHAGKSTWVGTTNKEVFIHSTYVSKTINPTTSVATLTKKGTIHYSNTGAHIVPAPYY